VIALRPTAVSHTTAVAAIIPASWPPASFAVIS
jgi:hypothetical protein